MITNISFVELVLCRTNIEESSEGKPCRCVECIGCVAGNVNISDIPSPAQYDPTQPLAAKRSKVVDF